MFPLPIHILFEIGCFLISLVFWYKIRNSKLRWFMPFLLFMVVVELYGRYLRKELLQPNAWLYNLSVPIEYLFYSFIFLIHYKSKLFQNAVKIFMVLFFIFIVANILVIQGFHKFNTNILKIGSFSMIILSCLYFTELLKTESRINLLSEPLFWIATGVFLFNTGEFLYSLFSDFLIINHLDRTRIIFVTINNKLIWLLYTCLAISFLCIAGKKLQRA